MVRDFDVKQLVNDHLTPHVLRLGNQIVRKGQSAPSAETILCPWPGPGPRGRARDEGRDGLLPVLTVQVAVWPPILGLHCTLAMLTPGGRIVAV